MIQVLCLCFYPVPLLSEFDSDLQIIKLHLEISLRYLLLANHSAYTTERNETTKTCFFKNQSFHWQANVHAKQMLLIASSFQRQEAAIPSICFPMRQDPICYLPAPNLSLHMKIIHANRRKRKMYSSGQHILQRGKKWPTIFILLCAFFTTGALQVFH